MSIPWRPAARARIRRAILRISFGRFIFVYHRVAEPAHDPWNLAVAPARFAEQLQAMRAYGPVMPLPRMLRELDAGTLPARAIAVTFDDGYADTLLAAKPLLDRHDVPATVNLCPDLLDGQTSFWWDSLSRIVFEPETLPSRLHIRLGDHWLAWEVKTAPERTGPEAPRRARAGGAGRFFPPSDERRSLCLKLRELLRPLPREMQRQELERLSTWAGGVRLDDPSERPLTPAEAADVAGDGLVQIGAHTLTHVSLPAMGPERQKAEIEGSKSACEEIAGTPVESFAYPYGDHDASSVRLVRAAGFARALTTSPWSLRRRADRLRLPRIPLLDWDGAEMERRLASADFD